ncbi:serine/threonine-protein kinase [Dokdonella sp.]|uniref:serine/threonine-protein kinase n=1 Tax=Dokdonella sp. TaxID=2291710 RepID=UPI001B1C5E1B|nr:serine/threonine-protein kinase [Dokdonella sp.]MBO9662959.1 tetratricopeptide repeat protein [Dokdonella sp.]
MSSDSSDILARRRRAFVLLREALDVADEARGAWIARRCDGDDALADELRALLGTEKTDLLDDDVGVIAARLIDEDETHETLPAGTRLGDWTLVRRIGHGGMGTVFLAERGGDGYAQRGALKLVKRGMDSAAVLARFRRERQILSRLEHPNIARLLDGGVSAEGQPYFVMEYVDGATLRGWMADSRPDLDARLDAFLQLCEAVAHAHRHLVVHRDIKPENVLIAADGHARLLDFGIAKLLGAEDDGERTATQRRFVSRAYAAPEQITGDAATTATDVYQLGALLFELLTGTRFGEPRPTGAVSGWLVRAQAQGDAATRKAVPAPRLRGDAAIVVARATDADPARRYATVEALSADLRAWREGRPIAARPDSAGYRFRRFVGRHRVVTVAAALALAAILAGTTLTIWQARKAAEEARLARSAQAFLASVFDAAAPDAAAGEHVTARELLDRGSERIGSELADQPRLRGEMLLTLGSLYAQLAQYDQAARQLGEARATLAPTDAAGAARAALELSAVERELGKLDDAERTLAAVSATAEPALRSRALAERALLREKQGRFDEALADAREALQADLARGSAARAEQARDRQIEALMLARRARFDEAAATFEQAIGDARAVYGDEDTRVALMLNDYGAALAQKGRNKESEAQLLTALQIRRKRLGDAHPAVAETLQVLGATQRAQGRLDEAQAAQEEALRIQRAVFGNRHALIANTLNSLGMLEFARRRPVEGEPYFREAVDIYRSLGQADTPSAATTANNLATVLVQLGRYEEAEPLTRHALQIHLDRLGEKHPAVMSDLNSIAQLELRRGNLDSAVEHARRAVAVADSGAAPPREGAYAHLSYANVLNRAGRPADALREVDGAIATLEGLSADESRLPTARATRADALLGMNRLDEAQALADSVLADYRRRTPNDAGGLAALHALRARIADARHRRADAQRERALAQQIVAGMSAPDPYLLREIARR